MKKRILYAAVAGMMLLTATGCGATLTSEEAKEVIAGLELFTVLEQEEDSYGMLYDFVYDDWSIRYSEGGVVSFDYSSVEDFLVDAFGASCMYDDERGHVCYAFEDNRISIYLQAEMEDGKLSIISYDIDDEEYTVNIDSERYNASDELIECMEEYDVIDNIQKEIDEFKQNLKDNDVDFEQVCALTRDDIKDYLE